ncbi:ABC transporter substrate-binding protein [Rhizobium sp.]|uniref:ABC transporter substrate-binding protein n=1 Tax=Rhizobium sp. TaxID=391 RepID=UPI002EED41F3
MRRLLSMSLALVLIASAAYAAPVEGGKINLIVQPEPPSLMIGITTNGPSLAVGGNIFESLLRYDEKLQPMPSLAKSWTVSDDGLTYTFTLQDNVVFHDGKPMTSADVLFTVNDFLTKTQPRHRNLMDRVASVTAPDDKTVVFKLKQPFEPFIRAFNFSAMPIVPKHLYEGTDYATNPNNEKPIGTGPFKFVEWKKGSYIKLAKNTDYYIKGKPYLDEIYYQIIPDGAARAVAYETGKVDVLPGGSVENFDVPRLSALPNTCVTEKGWEYFSPLSWLWLNNRVPPMDNPKFRQAIMYALDREFAKDALWNGMGKVATGPFSSKLPFYKAAGQQYEFNPDKAKELLKEIGYNGTGKPLRLLPLPYGETWQRWAEAVKQNLADVGIPVEIEATDVAGWNQHVSNWDYDLAFTYLYQNGDPAIGVERNYKTTQISKGSPWNNVEGYSNPEVDKLFDTAAVAYPAAERQKIYDQVQAKLQDDVPVAWLLELGFPTIYNCKFQDIVTTANGLAESLRDTWIQK